VVESESPGGHVVWQVAEIAEGCEPVNFQITNQETTAPRELIQLIRAGYFSQSDKRYTSLRIKGVYK
jgi:hypothetical protein